MTVNYNVQCYKKCIFQIYCVILYSSKYHVSTKLFGSTVIINIYWNQHIRMISEWFVIKHILKYIHIKQHRSDITLYLYFSLNKCHFGELKRLNKNINTFHWPQTFVQNCTCLWLYVTQSVIHPQHWFKSDFNIIHFHVKWYPEWIWTLFCVNKGVLEPYSRGCEGSLG